MTSFGMWGIIPPLLTIVLAFVTKDVIVSLFFGILSGTLIVAGGNPALALMHLTDALAASLADGWNIRIFLFCALLGGLVGMLSKTGAAGAFGRWASLKLKTSKGSLLMSFIFGLIIFIDDYFNSLTVGTIMRPICDKTKVARAKLAYVLDSTAAPVCIIAPISSWVVTVMSIVKGAVAGEVENTVNDSAKPADMLFPIIVLIATALIFFPVTTWMGAVDGTSITSFLDAARSIPLGDAFKDTDASVALFYAIIFTIFATYIYYIARKLLNLSGAGEALRDGIKSMIPALIILSMAWTIGTVIKSSPDDGGLGLGVYLSEIVVKRRFPLELIPVIVFALSALISFATGTSWGTFGIMIPLVMPIATGLAQAKGLPQEAFVNACMICIAAVVGGAVFGDHASPISDTTILSSTGAGCPHLEHVATQMPYAVFIALCSAIGFIAGGFSENIIAAWLSFALVLVIGIVFLPKTVKSKAD